MVKRRETAWLLILLLGLWTFGCSDSNCSDSDCSDPDAGGDTDTNPSCENGCLIDGECVLDGYANPDNSCQKCDTGQSQTDWSNNDGAICDDGEFCTVGDICTAGTCAGTARDCSDGVDCTGDETCNETAGACEAGTPTCTAPEVCDAVQDTCVTTCAGCLIDTVCYGDDQANPLNVCEKCDVSASQTSWTANDGASCDDGDFCNGADTCLSGACTENAGDPCTDDGIFCNGTESCNETTDTCDHAGDPCTGDDLCLEADDQCCLPNVPATTPVCNSSGDSESQDSCGNTLVEDCADTNGGCFNGLCACFGNYAPNDCTDCLPGWTGTACDQCVVYVNNNLSSYTGHDGSTWNLAFENIQDGIDEAEAGGCQVWVVAGTYLPTEDTTGNTSPGYPRSKTISLRSGVAVYGGFVGTELQLDERDVAANTTTLSGDLSGDDAANFTNYSDNAHHVLTGADNAILDGFTISGGSASGGPDPSYIYGAGIHNDNVSPTVSNCTFTLNSAIMGAGIADRNGAASAVTDCVFDTNVSNSTGAAIHSSGASTTVTDCEFDSNTTSSPGGGVYGENGSNITVTNSTFTANSGAVGGAVYVTGNGTTISLLNCTLAANTTTGGPGGGIYTSSEANSTITNSILWSNTGAVNGQSYTDADATCNISYSDIEGGCAATINPTCGDGNIDADPLFVTGDLRLTSTSPCIDQGHDPSAPSEDKDGNPRADIASVANCATAGDPSCAWYSDMGAYEVQ